MNGPQLHLQPYANPASGIDAVIIVSYGIVSYGITTHGIATHRGDDADAVAVQISAIQISTVLISTVLISTIQIRTIQTDIFVSRYPRQQAVVFGLRGLCSTASFLFAFPRHDGLGAILMFVNHPRLKG